MLCTQRPSADVIPGLLKAQIHYTVAFRVRNQVNSRILLDCDDAANLPINPGRCIVQTSHNVQCQVPYMTEKTFETMVKNLTPNPPLTPLKEPEQTPAQRIEPRKDIIQVLNSINT